MESTDSSVGSQQPQQAYLPPGFRFHPTDEELLVLYLKKKTVSARLPFAIIAEVDLYKFEPWDLPAKATFGEQEWYFFSPRDRKRPNRETMCGYWKATGRDKPVLTSGGTQNVGVKKSLVFYVGKPPKQAKTNWIMHEYRLAENKANNRPPGCDLGNKKNSLGLDDWVLCRISRNDSVKSTGGFPGLLEECSERNGMPCIQPCLSDKDNYQDFEANLNPCSSSLLLDVPALQYFDMVEPSVASDSLFPKENPREADPKHVMQLLPESNDQNEKCPDPRPRLEPAEMFDAISLGSLAASETREERHATGEKTVNVPNISLNDSAKSTGVAGSTGGAGSKRDWAWKYCSSIPGNSNGVICSFCDLEIKGGGITRFKSHISGNDLSKNVKKCKNVPLEVKAEIDQKGRKRR